MSDDVTKKEPDGSPAAPDSAELVELRKQLAELQTAIEAEKQRKADAIAERDKEREKRKKEAEAKAAYDEAKQLMSEQLAEAQARLAEMKELETYRDRWITHETERRKALVAAVPEQYRARAEKWDIEVLEDFVAMMPQKQGPGAVPGKGGGAPVGSKPWAEMAAQERAELSATDPALALQKAKEWRTSRR